MFDISNYGLRLVNHNNKEFHSGYSIQTKPCHIIEEDGITSNSFLVKNQYELIE